MKIEVQHAVNLKIQLRDRTSTMVVSCDLARSEGFTSFTLDLATPFDLPIYPLLARGTTIYSGVG